MLTPNSYQRAIYTQLYTTHLQLRTHPNGNVLHLLKFQLQTSAMFWEMPAADKHYVNNLSAFQRFGLEAANACDVNKRDLSVAKLFGEEYPNQSVQRQ